jgi:hypothetical protein
MPTQEVITERFLHLQGQVDEVFKELFKRFQSTCEEEGAVVAMDRLGMEIAETECYAGLLYYALPALERSARRPCPLKKPAF